MSKYGAGTAATWSPRNLTFGAASGPPGAEEVVAPVAMATPHFPCHSCPPATSTPAHLPTSKPAKSHEQIKPTDFMSVSTPVLHHFWPSANSLMNKVNCDQKDHKNNDLAR